MAGIVAGKLDARFGELAREEFSFGQGGMGGRSGGIGPGESLGLRLAAVHPEGHDGGERAAGGDQRAPGEDVLHGLTADRAA